MHGQLEKVAHAGPKGLSLVKIISIVLLILEVNFLLDAETLNTICWMPKRWIQWSDWLKSVTTLYLNKKKNEKYFNIYRLILVSGNLEVRLSLIFGLTHYNFECTVTTGGSLKSQTLGMFILVDFLLRLERLLCYLFMIYNYF